MDKDSQLLEEQKALQQLLRTAQLRTAKQIELRTGQLKETGHSLDRLIASRNKLGQGDSSVLGRLLADAEIENAQRTVLELEREVNLDLPAMRDELEQKLAVSVRTHATIEADIAKARLQLVKTQVTRFITEPGLNPTPTGASKGLIIAVGVTMSALLAIMSVFVAEFIARARVELVGRQSG